MIVINVEKLDTHIFRKIIIKQIQAVIGEIISVVNIKAIAANSKIIEDNIEANEVIEDKKMKSVKRATHMMKTVSQSR